LAFTVTVWPGATVAGIGVNTGWLATCWRAALYATYDSSKPLVGVQVAAPVLVTLIASTPFWFGQTCATGLAEASL